MGRRVQNVKVPHSFGSKDPGSYLSALSHLQGHFTGTAARKDGFQDGRSREGKGAHWRRPQLSINLSMSLPHTPL